MSCVIYFIFYKDVELVVGGSVINGDSPSSFLVLRLNKIIYIYNSVQRFEPFQDQNQYFFGMISLSF